MAFLGLAVVSAPVAGAATDDNGSTGASADTGSGSGSETGASASGSSSAAGAAAGSSGSEAGDSGSGDSGSGDDGAGQSGGEAGNQAGGANAGEQTDDNQAGDSEADETSDGSSSTPTSTDPDPSSSTGSVDTTTGTGTTSTVETTTEPQPEAPPTTEAPAPAPAPTPTGGSEGADPEGASPATQDEGAAATAGTAKTMSLLADSADVSAAAVLIDPYGLPANPFNTTDPTRQQLNPIGQWVESIVPAYPAVDGFTSVSFAVTVVKFLNEVLGWTQQDGKDTIFSWPVYVLFAAAYQRLIDIGTNTLATAKVTETSQTLGLVTLKLDVANPDDVVYLPQLIGITGNGNTWVYEPISQTIVLTTLNPGMLLNGGDDTIEFTVDDTLGYLDHPIGAQSVTIDIPVHINPVITINGLPYFEIGAAEVTGTDVDGVVHGTVVAQDPDGDAITYTGSTLAGTGDVEVDADGN